ncbi:ead/Ea22-like family protein [Salmonella enterica]|nr:ead/Ea22-like family protein [Salmonella enterica]
MSNIDKQALRERYSPKPVPECHICGEEMTIQRISASRITYGCTGATYDDKGCHYAEGRSIADDHYEKSRVTVVDVSDPDVLALLDELEHYKSREERVTKLVLDNSTSWDVLYEKLEAAEKRIAEQREYYEGVIADGSKRIAELEKGHQKAAKQINSWRRLAKQNIAERGKDISELEAARQRIAELEDAQCQHESDTLMLCHQFDELASAMGWTSELAMKQGVGQLEYARSIKARIAELEAKLETADKLQDSAFRHGLKAGFSYGQTDDQSGFAQCMSAYSTRAGIGVKQQEDSVDSDVGRNQPGMVVAVHIDACDFVKFKGQVFEVEETDFDDHDVTLWFVGGNTLKCAAGCQVEVVSAPVAAGIKVKGSEHDRSTKR